MPEVDLPCPRRHFASYEIPEPGGYEIDCTQCASKRKTRRRATFHCLYSVECVEAETRVWEELNQHMGFAYTGAVRGLLRIVYANPDPPPEQKLSAHEGIAIPGLVLRPGHIFTLIGTLPKRGGWFEVVNAPPTPTILINHTLDETFFARRAASLAPPEGIRGAPPPPEI